MKLDSKALMKVDTLPFKYMVIAFCCGAGILAISLIIGACGPDAKVYYETFAYNCPNASHEWSSECTGVRPAYGDKIVVDTPLLKSDNRFWSLVARPFNKLLQKNQNYYSEGVIDVVMVVNVSSRETLEGDWNYEAMNQMYTFPLHCPIGVKTNEDVTCDAITLAFEDTIDAAFHKVEVTLISADNSSAIAIGDVSLTLSYGTLQFATFGIAFNVVFLLLSLAAFLIYIYRIRSLLFHGWSFEQLWTLLLLFAVVFYNNPLFALEYAMPGWFFPFLDALLKDLFLALLILFWLLSVEKYRDLDEFNWKDKKHGIKVTVAAVFLVFAVVTFSWSIAAVRRDPVLSSPFEIPGVVALYVITVIILTGAVGWYIFIAVLALPKIAHSAVLFTRFLFISIPAFVVVLSVFIGAVTGNFGTVSTSASNCLDTAYFITLYNVLTWILAFGFWPAESHFGGGNAQIIEEDSTESQSFLHNETPESKEKDSSIITV